MKEEYPYGRSRRNFNSKPPIDPSVLPIRQYAKRSMGSREPIINYGTTDNALFDSRKEGSDRVSEANKTTIRLEEIAR
jgi:hypothetical protein